MLTLTSTGRQSCTLQSRFLNSLSDTHTLPPASATDNGKAVLCSFLWVPNPPPHPMPQTSPGPATKSSTTVCGSFRGLHHSCLPQGFLEA